MSKGTVKQTSWNFIQGMVEPGDPDLFFGPLVDGERVFGLSVGEDMLDVLVRAGVFPSKGEARRNGWEEDREPELVWKERGHFCVVRAPGRSVPMGFTHFRIGKGKATEIAILRVK